MRDSESSSAPASTQLFLKRERTSVPGEMRKRRRRLDLKTLDGTLRESGRLYRELAEGRISMAECEVRSRALKRHAEILGTVREAQQLEQLQEQIAALQNRPTTPPLLEQRTPEWMRDEERA